MLLALTACLLGLTGLAGWALRVQARRRAALRAFAAEHGWHPVRVRPRGLPLGRGAQRARGGLAGTWGGRPARAYEVSVRTVHGQGSVQVQTWAVLEVQLPAPLPALDLVPLHGLSRPVARLLPAAYEPESEDVARRYRFGTRDPRTAAAVLGPRTLQVLLDRPPVRVRLDGDRALCWATGRLEPDGLRERLGTVTALLDGVPGFVWSDAALEVRA